ncbi:Methylenetetrahydrofolate reductase [Eumeta japonica]|uniref:Methylenetetrahydrofolate reductase n=1 Tax=Eumeta variegata TaxID=151549 RepID=A0A4C1ZNU5_EUMVA|nr:Methylenetetrahydrofolate reductase [Eumeta japonica]
MPSECVKLTDLIKTCTSFSYSVEVTPEIDIEELNNVELQPLFCSITWHAKTHRCKSLDIPPIKVAQKLKDKGINVLLHVSCDFLRKSYLDALLNKLKDIQICNLFIVLGESFDPATSDFKNTKELISYIRDRTGDYFCIGVPGFPDYDDEKLKLLKDKVANGVDFILTQAFFESSVFLHYVERCRDLEINIPILAGVYIFETLQQLRSFIKMCRVKVSECCLDLMKKQHDESESALISVHDSIICDKQAFKVKLPPFSSLPLTIRVPPNPTTYIFFRVPFHTYFDAFRKFTAQRRTARDDQLWKTVTVSLNVAEHHVRVPTAGDMSYGRFLKRSPRHRIPTRVGSICPTWYGSGPVEWNDMT